MLGLLRKLPSRLSVMSNLTLNTGYSQLTNARLSATVCDKVCVHSVPPYSEVVRLLRSVLLTASFGFTFNVYLFHRIVLKAT